MDNGIYTADLHYSTDLGGAKQTRKQSYSNLSQKVAKFVKSKDFQRFCEVQGVESSTILRICCGKDCPVYELDNFDAYLDGYRITQEGEEKYYQAKTVKFINKPALKERIVTHSDVFFVWKQDGKWRAEKLLADETQLDRAKVLEGFKALSKLRGYQVSKLALAASGERLYWVCAVFDKEGNARELLTSLDAADVKDLPKGEVPLVAINLDENHILRTKFNYFRNIGGGKLERIKS